uniref:MADF domain-containing protein n=1 Tax=Panagrolaimus davidi TaxID=227884 RepID=A0A914P9X6_9BILA
MTSLEDLREWPQPTVMKLFELVKPHPILYDCTHEHWTNTIEKGRIWTRIAKQLNPYLTSKKCRDRFQSNKKKYATEIRKQIARGDDENVNLDLVWLLDQHDEEKENCSNLMETLKAGSPIDDHDVENGMHPHETMGVCF